MITIKCGKSSYNTTNIDSEAIFTINDDANLTEVFLAIVKASQFEGYSLDSWLNIINEMKNEIDKEYSILDFLTDSIYD
jgi:hypothetical protein